MHPPWFLGKGGKTSKVHKMYHCFIKNLDFFLGFKKNIFIHFICCKMQTGKNLNPSTIYTINEKLSAVHQFFSLLRQNQSYLICDVYETKHTKKSCLQTLIILRVYKFLQSVVQSVLFIFQLFS